MAAHPDALRRGRGQLCHLLVLDKSPRPIGSRISADRHTCAPPSSSRARSGPSRGGVEYWISMDSFFNDYGGLSFGRASPISSRHGRYDLSGLDSIQRRSTSSAMRSTSRDWTRTLPTQARARAMEGRVALAEASWPPGPVDGDPGPGGAGQARGGGRQGLGPRGGARRAARQDQRMREQLPTIKASERSIDPTDSCRTAVDDGRAFGRDGGPKRASPS